MDPKTIGQQLKQQHPAYANYPDELVGMAYLRKINPNALTTYNQIQNAPQEVALDQYKTQAMAPYQASAAAQSAAATEQAKNANNPLLPLQTQKAQQEVSQNQAFSAIQKLFEANKGNDNKVSPQTYNSAKSQASALGIKSDDFDKTFEQSYTNPKNPNYDTTTDIGKMTANINPEGSKAAQQLLDVLDAGQNGKLKDKAYKDALNFAAANLAKTAFGTGGKTLSETEQSLLQATIPRMQVKSQTLIDKLLGIQPTQSGETIDDPESLRRKALIARDYYAGKPFDINALSNTNESKGNLNMSPAGLLGNAGGDIKSILNGILNIPAAAGQAIQHPNQIPAMGKNVLSGILDEYNQALGKPLEGGDILGKMGQHAYEHPVNTLTDILPFLKAAQLVKGAKVAGDVGEASNAITPLEKMGIGTKLRQGVRNIDVGPNLSGASKEIQINHTLDQLGIIGSPAQQYSQLQPKMAQLSDYIEKTLNNSPKNVPLTDIVSDFDKNLSNEGLYRRGQLTKDTANKEASKYIKDLYNSAHDSNSPVIPENISTPDLFKLKQDVNKDYKSVQKKINAGESLTEREKVISVARQTFDDIIAEKHPSVKKATLMQSNLYDAVDSLYKSRGNNSTLRLPGGINIPLPNGAVQGGQDFLGRLLQGGKKSPLVSPQTEAESSAQLRPNGETTRYMPSNSPLEGSAPPEKAMKILFDLRAKKGTFKTRKGSTPIPGRRGN